jgi:hypothetical protein
MAAGRLGLPCADSISPTARIRPGRSGCVPLPNRVCRLVDDFTRGKSADDYANEPLLRSGVERQLEIVGEALSQGPIGRVLRSLGRDHLSLRTR